MDHGRAAFGFCSVLDPECTRGQGLVKTIVQIAAAGRGQSFLATFQITASQLLGQDRKNPPILAVERANAFVDGSMPQRARAQYHEIRLAARAAWLRRRERAELCRLGEEITRTEVVPGPELRPLVDQVLAALARVDRCRAERRASVAADRADMAVVPGWVKPAVGLRGLCTRLVLRQRESAEVRALDPIYVSIGTLAAERTDARAVRSGVAAVRAELRETDAERARWGFPYGGSAFPAWSTHAGSELMGLGRAVGVSFARASCRRRRRSRVSRPDGGSPTPSPTRISGRRCGPSGSDTAAPG